MKTIIIFVLVVLISYSQSVRSIDYNILYQCPDDKIKIGEDVCAIETSEGCSKDIYYKVYIKKKSCGKNKKCSSGGSVFNIKTDSTCGTTNSYAGSTTDSIYTCRKKLKLLKIDKKCNYNAECSTGYCNNHKCAAYGDDVKCRTYENNCAPGKYCKEDSSSSSTGTCTSYLGEGNVCSSTTADCAPGLSCFYPSGESTGTCKKYFSVDKGEYASSVEFCKSIYLVGTKCAEIISVNDNTCTITYNDGGSDTEDKNTNNVLTTLSDGTNVCKYKAGVKDLLTDIVKRYNKIKLNKVLEKENCDYDGYLCDKKYAELISVYNDYGKLLHHGIIKENGKKDKKCEYEFWRTVSVSSSYIKICLGFAFTLLSLLF